MRQIIPQLIVIVSGAVLLAVGIGLIIPQYQIEMSIYKSKEQPVNTSAINPPKREGDIPVNTSYVGVMVLSIGATLEIVGCLSTLARKRG
jgi:hypothetical protein